MYFLGIRRFMLAYSVKIVKKKHCFMGYLVDFSGSCTSKMAANINTQPKSSRGDNAPPVKFQPQATKMTVVKVANTDSKLIKMEAEVGSVYFCPTI